MSKQVRKIEIKVSTTGEVGLKRVSKEMAKMNRSVKSLDDGFGKLKRTMMGFAAAIGIREIAQAADSYQLLNDRMKVFSKTTEEANKTFRSVAAVANTTRTSVEAIAESYTRVAIATQELGLTQSQMLATTQALQQTFRISGATIAEATGATIQLTQGLSSGQLRGQELRSVMEANGILAGILAKKLGIARGQLIKFAESGKISSKVVLEALAENFEKLNKDAEKLGVTFEQSTIFILNKVKMKIHEMNQTLGISSGFNKFAIVVTDNLEVVGAAVITLTTLVTVKAIPSMIASLRLLYATLMSNPWTAIATVILGAITYMALTWDKTLLRMRKAFLYFKKIVIDSVNAINNAFNFIGRKLRSLFNIKKKKYGSSLEKDSFLNGIVGKDYKKTLNEIDEINKKLEKMKREENGKIFKASFDGLNIKEVKKTAKEFYLLNEKYKEGKISLEQYNEAIRKNEQEKINKSFLDGKVTLDQYYQAIMKAQGATDELFGKSSLTIGIEQGLKQVENGIGSLAQNVANAVKGAFSTLENQLFKFVQTGKFVFADFTKAILDDLTKIIIRMAIIRPLAGMMFGGFGGAAAGAINPSMTFASNTGAVLTHATGAVVSGTTYFTSGGQVHSMGENGPEAIMPLVRKNGKLGVEGGGTTIVNVINNGNSDVETKETTGANGEKIIDVMIVEKVNRAIGEGRLDATFKQVYGLNRRGR